MALRHVAGYVCRTLRRKLESSSDPNKDDMIFCLFSLCGDESVDGRLEVWCNLIDKGGLSHVNDETYVCVHTLLCHRRRH